jgi:hypothetical protein
MRFMMLMIPRVYQPGAAADETGIPSAELIAAMMKYNEELTKAGVLLGLDGLHPLSKGARVSFSRGTPKVIDGPFTETKEVIGGYWLINVPSKDEAVSWARRCPAQNGDVIEVRQVQQLSDFPQESIPEISPELGRIGSR